MTMLFPEILMSNDQGHCMRSIRSLFSFDITSFFKKFSLCVTKYSLIILPLKRVSHTLMYLKKKQNNPCIHGKNQRSHGFQCLVLKHMVLGQPGNQSGASVGGKGLLVIHFTRLEFRNVIWEFVCLRLVYVAMIKESD